MLSEESLPAKLDPPAMKVARPAPEPVGSYVMVTSGFAVWKAAIHDSWALPWLDAPAPTKVPVRLETVASGAAASLLAHEESASAATAAVAAMAAKRPVRVMFTVK